METLIQSLVKNIKSGKIEGNDAKILAIKYRDAAMAETIKPLEHGQVNLHKMYVGLLNELEKAINECFVSKIV